MTSLKFDISGMDNVVKGLKKLDGHLERALQLIAKGVGFEIANELRIYPKQRSNTTYDRTDRLKHGWHVKKRGRTSAVVGNPVPYAPYVQSKSQQAWMHKGWWAGHTDVDAIEEVEDAGDVERTANRVIRRILRMAGLE